MWKLGRQEPQVCAAWGHAAALLRFRPAWVSAGSVRHLLLSFLTWYQSRGTASSSSWMSAPAFLLPRGTVSGPDARAHPQPTFW